MKALGRALGVILAFLLPAGIYAVTMRPLRDQAVGDAERQAWDLERRLESARAAEQKLPQFREEVARLRLENLKLRRILPVNADGDRLANETLQSLEQKEPSPVGLREHVQRAAHQSNVDLLRYAGHPVTNRDDGLQTLSAEVRVSGKITDITNLLASLERKALIIDLTGVTIRKEAGENWQSDFVATSYSLPN